MGWLHECDGETTRSRLAAWIVISWGMGRGVRGGSTKGPAMGGDGSDGWGSAGRGESRACRRLLVHARSGFRMSGFSLRLSGVGCVVFPRPKP